MKRVLFIFPLLLFMTSDLSAAEKFILDKSHTSIIWFASHLGFSDSTGQFTNFEGEFVIDEEKPTESSLNVTIHMNSIQTGIPKFDAHLKNKDFFYVTKFPEASFESTKILLKPNKEAEIHGNLTMMNITKPFVLHAKLNKIDQNPFNKKKTAGFSLTGTVKRSEYGITYALPAVPDEVKLIIEAEGIKVD